MMASTRLASQACGLLLVTLFLLASLSIAHPNPVEARQAKSTGRGRISINAGWRFQRFTSNPDSLSYNTLKSFILPSGNDFIAGSKRQKPSATAPGADIKFVQANFDDSSWTQLNLPHDWAIKGPFGAPGVSSGMGKLPSNGVGWYRKNLTFTTDDAKKTVYLDIDGAMSYSAVWLNGKLVGGWPFGYASFRLDLTPYLKVGSDNILAIRLDNPLDNSRWYPGAGIYRNVWLVKVEPLHVAQYGTYITTPKVSAQSATVNLNVTVENTGASSQQVNVVTTVHPIDAASGQPGSEVASFSKATANLAAGAKQILSGSVTITNPALWGPVPAQKPNLYLAETVVSLPDGATLDTYTTQFGIRSVTYDINKGIHVNGQYVRVQGLCNHHDLGSLGAAFNLKAQIRQLEALQEMGANALRTSHNPPAPEFLELADKMGFMVMDEIFDCWQSRKTTNDFHLIFDDWSEPDLRNFLRRDRNHPSIIAWSIGNEVGEQGSASGGTIASRLRDIVRSEDPTRQITAAMNAASAGSAMANAIDIPGLNYQGEGMGTSPNSAYPAFRKQYPNRMLWSTESSSAVSSRGVYIFPVTSANSATVGGANAGGNPTTMQVSDYGLYATSWGSSPDKVFEQQDKYPYVAGEFVWTGWDYIGEPTPYNARSSYFGIIDLAGFKKDRFWLYQARWNPTVRMAHILPHWTWPDRVGQVTPVHVFSSADEAELFVNGKSQGRLKKAASSTYRFRWDKVTYQPGEVKVLAYKDGKEWATETRKTAGDAVGLRLAVEKNVTSVAADGQNLAFVTVAVVDKDGEVVPWASHTVNWKVEGAGEIVSTDNGDATDMTSFGSLSRKVFGGLGLAIVRAKGAGEIKLSAEANGLRAGSLTLVGK
ncbi:glycoside hydrolase [Naviculisporaceae sp. PSN 640]